MDSPIPPGVTIHEVPFSLMGVMAPIPTYQAGDWVRYGAMLYKPTVGGGMVHITGDYLPESGAAEAWPGESGKTKHHAAMWGKTFYCS